MAILDTLSSMFFERKISKVFAMVTRLTGWSLGLDNRMTGIETRLGAIEMALTEQGVDLAAMSSTVTAAVITRQPKPTIRKPRKKKSRRPNR